MPWQDHLRHAIQSSEELCALLNLSSDRLPIDSQPDFPVRVPRPFVARMRPGDPADPLLRQVLASPLEQQAAPGFVTDPLEEHQGVLPGLLHKYRSRVLLIFRGGCAVNCRYCFRRHYPYQAETLRQHDLDRVVDYLRQHPEVNEVIFSGGDPLMADDAALSHAMRVLAALPQIQRLRIHTRLPVVIPDRVTEAFVTALGALPIPVIVVLHINHAQEIDQAVVDAVSRLRTVCRAVLNQAVVLAGVNDTATAQIALSERLFAAGIDPYYLNVLDQVSGASHFAVIPESIGEIHREMLAALPGYLVPKLVREVPGVGHKVPWTKALGQ